MVFSFLNSFPLYLNAIFAWWADNTHIFDIGTRACTHTYRYICEHRRMLSARTGFHSCLRFSYSLIRFKFHQIRFSRWSSIWLDTCIVCMCQDTECLVRRIFHFHQFLVIFSRSALQSNMTIVFMCVRLYYVIYILRKRMRSRERKIEWVSECVWVRKKIRTGKVGSTLYIIFTLFVAYILTMLYVYTYSCVILPGSTVPLCSLGSAVLWSALYSSISSCVPLWIHSMYSTLKKYVHKLCIYCSM